MARSLQTLKDSLNLRLRDKTNGTVESADMTNFFNRAIDELKSRHEFPGTKQRAEFNIYSGVNEYPVPSGYKSVIDFRAENDSVDFEKRTSKEFWHDVTLLNNIHADDNYNETKILLVNRTTVKSNELLHDCDSLTSNGTWAIDATTDAVNLTLDEAEKKQGSGSLNFDLDVSVGAGNAASITNSTLTAVDLDAHENQSVLFAWVYIPDTTYLSSFGLRWGSDASNYWSNTVTAQYSGISFKTGWNRIGFVWNTATATGSPSASAVDYLQFTVNYSVSQTDDTDFRLDEIRSIVPERATINYYSSNFTKSSGGTPMSQAGRTWA